MKKLGLFYIASLLIVGILPNWSLAQDQTQWHFAEGAKMRLGKGRINHIKFSPNGSRFAVATSIGIWMYDADTGEELSLLAVLPGEGRMVATIAFSPDGRTLASGEFDGVGRLWDILTGRPIATFKEVASPRYTGLTTLVFSENGKKLMGATTREISAWKLGEDIKQLTTLQLEKANTVRPITSVLISPDGRFLAAQLTDWKNKNFQIQLWDTATGKLSHTLTGHTGWIKSIAFSADSKTLVSGDTHETIRLWDTATGKLKSVLNWKHGTSTHTLAFSPNGRFIASGHYDGVKLWDNTVKPKQQTEDAIGNYQHTLALHGHKDYVSKLAFSPDGKTLLTGSKDGTIQAWDTATGNHRFTCPGHFEGIRGLVFSLDGNTLTSLNQPFNPSGIVQRHQWNTNTGQLLSTDFLTGSRGPTPMAISPDGKTVAAHRSGGRCSLWDLTTAPPQVIDRFSLEGFPRGGLDVKMAFSVDGRMLATGGEDGLVHVWTLIESEKIRHRFTVKGHKHNIRTLAFSPDGKMLASGGKGGTLCLWRVTDGASLFTSTAHKSLINTVAFSPDSKTLASGGKELFFWNTSTGTQLRPTSRKLTAWISTLVFSPDGNTLVAGNWDGILELWDVRPGGLLSTHTGHTWWVEVLKFSPDGRTLVSSSFWDGTILIWDWETLKKTKNR
ncbi:WD40 repeat domain-containing protein [Candidatus Poribacteria bacterium]|nr:WD40 repeat domain-containing protein [Candidatus Poribacteria bacterium]MYG07000.1 WD40 repeat domain-containing protein [Candidatus Poribacteria bacterium]MYK22804.1 WD40 repeat domain-containing protein [Candidatus Poribacteria bacterium]